MIPGSWFYAENESEKSVRNRLEYFFCPVIFVLFYVSNRIKFLGVGGFNARMRTLKSKEKMDDDGMDRDMGNEEASSSDSLLSMDEKPRKKKSYRKPKSKFAESYPSYIQVILFRCCIIT